MVHYTDRDEENMNVEEYNFAYALWPETEGWIAEDEEDVVGTVHSKHLTKKVSNVMSFLHRKRPEN